MKKDRTCIESERLRLAFDLFETGLRIHRATLRRRHPDESPEQIEARLLQWLQERPDAPHGDAEGRSLGPERFSA